MADSNIDLKACSGAAEVTGERAKTLRWKNVPALILGIILIPTVLVAFFAHGVVSEMAYRIKRRFWRRTR